MSIYDQIAQGTRPIGADLPQVAQLLDQRNRFQQLQEMQNEERAYQRGREQKADERAEAQQHHTEAFLTADWALRSGSPRAALDELPEVTAALDAKGIPWRDFDDRQAAMLFSQVRAKHAPKAGIAAPQPKEAELPTSYRESLLARQDPEYAAFLEAERKKAGVQVNVGPQVVESEADKAFGKLEGEGYAAVLERGQAAGEKASSLRAMRDSPAITGPTQDVKAAATALFSGLGIPVPAERLNQVANLGQYKAIANQLVLTEQLKQKGPQTESDAKRIAESFGRSANLQETNRLILNYQLALAEREALLAGMAEDYRQRTGKIDGWRQELRKYVQSTPLAGVNPTSKRLVFWNEFVEAMREDNPGMGEEEIMGIWRERYGGSR